MTKIHTFVIYVCRIHQPSACVSLILSAISAINSELVGLPFPLLIVYPKRSLRTSGLPLFHATSMACLMARSTLLGVVSNYLAIVGYNIFVMLFIISGSLTAKVIDSLKY